MTGWEKANYPRPMETTAVITGIHRPSAHFWEDEVQAHETETGDFRLLVKISFRTSAKRSHTVATGLAGLIEALSIGLIKAPSILP